MSDSTRSQADQLALRVAKEFRRRVLEEYVPRIRHCVSLLDEDQLWHKPGPHNNSVGNLLMHLAGNVRQWIQVGIGDEADLRDRDAEFQGNQDAVQETGSELMKNLEDTVREAVGIVDELGPNNLLEVHAFQGGRYEESLLGAVLHVMEHFSGHAGQIYAATKQTLGIDLKFYNL
ncbi:MAG: DinB family protein [Planctomycetota bacterium]